MGPSAELIADGGAGAAAAEFFRSPSFHRAEGVTHTLRLSSPGRAAGEPAAGAIAAVSDRHLHYFIGGTAEDARGDSPFKLVAWAMQGLADSLRLPLNLGGGGAPGDGLERFKRGFANAEATFHTHEVVCDPAAYRALTSGRSPAAFFPLYRAP